MGIFSFKMSGEGFILLFISYMFADVLGDGLRVGNAKMNEMPTFPSRTSWSED